MWGRAEQGRTVYWFSDVKCMWTFIEFHVNENAGRKYGALLYVCEVIFCCNSFHLEFCFKKSIFRRKVAGKDFFQKKRIAPEPLVPELFAFQKHIFLKYLSQFYHKSTVNSLV